MASSDEITSNDIDTQEDENNYSGTSTANAETKLNDLEKNNNSLSLLEDAAQNITSQDRISYHTKRGAPKYPRYTLTTIHRPNKYHSRRSRPSYSKSRKKHRRSRRKPLSFSSPSIIPAGPPIISGGPPIISSGPSIISGGAPIGTKSKDPFKQNKPILLSELLRSSQIPFVKFKPNNLAPRPVHEFVNEGEILESNPFSSVGTPDSLPPTVKQFGRPPPGIEVTDVHNNLPPVNALEEGIVYPGAADIKPISGQTFRRPGEIYFNKPSDTYIEDYAADNIRNVRLANNPQNNYVDKEILNLLQKMKQDGVSLESRPEITTPRNKVKDTTAAISKLLSPFLSESSIKKIRSYLNLGLSSSQKKEKETEKNVNNIVIVENPKNDGDDKSITVTEPPKEDEGRYFIMLKQKNNKTASATVGVQTLKNKTKNEKSETTTSATETKTPISLQSLELQHYIMSLAGLGESQTKDYRNDDYLPRFTAFQDKQPRSL